MELVLRDLQNAYVHLVHHVLTEGQQVRCRDQWTTEITAATLIFPDVNYTTLLPLGVNRGVNLKLAAVEALQLVAGESHPDLVLAAAPEFAAVMVDPTDLDYGAYGPRLKVQLHEIVKQLLVDGQSRQAVAHIWSSNDLWHEGDKPCTIFLNFLVRDLRLELHVHMRSNDVWLGVPYDVFAFTQLQHTVARALQLLPGQYVHHATSLHLYERDIERAEKLTLFNNTTSRPPELPHGVRYRQQDAPDEWITLRAQASRILHGEFSTDINRWYVEQLKKVMT